MFIKILIVLSILFTAWLLSSLYLMSQSNSLIFQNKVSWTSIPNNGSYTEEFIKGGENNSINVRHYNSTNTTSEKVILYTHGNAGRLVNFFPELQKIGQVYSPAYPGYSESEGNPSQEASFDAAIRTYDYLVNVKKVPESNIILFGHSLGGSIATYLASQRPNASKLVLLNTFSSMQSMCFSKYTVLCAFTNDVFNSANFAKNVKMDVLHFGYDKDQTVPYEETAKLAKYFTSAKSYKQVTLTDFHHSYPDWKVVLPLL
jgi:predicted esterase